MSFALESTTPAGVRSQYGRGTAEDCRRTTTLEHRPDTNQRPGTRRDVVRAGSHPAKWERGAIANIRREKDKHYD